MADPGRLSAPYEGFADRFEQHARSGAYNAHYDRPAVLDALGDVTGLSVLDAACGPGLYLEELLGRGAGAVTGFDAAADMVRRARERFGTRARIDRAALGGPLPYGDASFDRAICALAIHYVDDRPAAYRELLRVLRPGGVLVVSTQHPTGDWLRLGGSYFDVAEVTEEWPAHGVAMAFWREPMSAVVDAARDGGFLLDRLIEPRPATSMEEADPASYERLATSPGFVVLRLVRP